MLIYKNERTKDIVSQFIKISNAIRNVTSVGTGLILGILFAAGTAILWSEAWWVGGIIGLALGLALGAYIASFFTVILEWMAQMLVAQGEILSTHKEYKRFSGITRVRCIWGHIFRITMVNPKEPKIGSPAVAIL